MGAASFTSGGLADFRPEFLVVPGGKVRSEVQSWAWTLTRSRSPPSSHSLMEAALGRCRGDRKSKAVPQDALDQPLICAVPVFRN